MNNDRIYYSHDAETQAMRELTKLTLLCLMLGLGIGAAVAFLFAPSTGKKVRHDLAQSMEDGLNNGQEALGPMVRRLEKELSDVRKNVEERVNNR